MKVIREYDENATLRYISFSNTFLSRVGTRRHIRSMDGVSDIPGVRLYGVCEFYCFNYKNKEFCLNEDWGDSSVYDITTKEDCPSELEEIARHMETFRFDPVWLIIGTGALSIFSFLVLYKK